MRAISFRRKMLILYEGMKENEFVLTLSKETGIYGGT